MSALIIDGKQVAAQIRSQLAQEVAQMKEGGITPGLAVVIVGDDPASRVYVNMKKKACDQVGIYSREYALPQETEQDQLLALIEELNRDPAIHGILVQLPLPSHLEEERILEAIDPAKDVDGFHPINVGKLALGQDCLVPCTPAGIIRLIKETGLPIAGQEAVVVGRSNIVGKPVAQLLLGENATVTLCHSRTRDLAEVCRRADILVAAVGRPAMIRGDWIKPGAIVIDVGINRVDGKLVGDVAFGEAQEHAGYITPVPGGVGPMTIAMLLQNTVHAARA
ncbi:MAG: bifunctional methylenetetrahydrofolate dehydrogenase/methenyltetrahydrofolate cyclohydrolase FolD [Limnochordia bacterium]|jgi:methylenetetrahydrofolate dehydrogenase (NADP+)/methenyltetrahydrofolate cyclohydrolase